MTKKAHETALPKRRFPEFRDEPGWKEEALAANLHEHKLKSDGKSEVYSVSVHKGVINQIEHLGRSFAAADTSKYSLVKPFDIIYTKSPTGDFPYGIVKQNLTGRKVIVSPLYGVFSPLNEYVGYLVHCYFESSIRTTNYLASLVQKGAKNTIQISNDRFLSKAIYLPSIEAEQRKIAAALSSLDALLTAQTAKLQALQAHKRGLMQDLFPAAGEMVPKRRFPEFRGAGEWAKKPFGSFCLGISSGKDKNDPKGIYHLYGSTGVIGKTNIDSHSGDFILAARVGANAGFLKRANGKFGVTDNTLVISLNKSENIDFVYYTLEKFGLNQLMFGSGQPLITGGQLKSLPLCWPQPAEQQKIADCLSSLDNLITAQGQKLAALQRHKKGLMQALFPAASEPNA